MKKETDTKNDLQFSSFIFRSSAFIIDSLLIASLWGVIITLFKVPTYNIAFFLYLVYCFISTAIFSTSLGKFIFNMKVVTNNNKKPGILKSFIREVPGKFLSSIPFSLGFFWALFNKRKQTWHDLIARTFVVFVKTPETYKVVLAYAIFIIFIVVSIYQLVNYYTNFLLPSL
jgi:uncharacterized RDD family membrane protein YckC